MSDVPTNEESENLNWGHACLDPAHVKFRTIVPCQSEQWCTCGMEAKEAMQLAPGKEIPYCWPAIQYARWRKKQPA